MFPASFNAVLYKQIQEIIHFKCGKGTTDDTEVASGINCPHCRKKPSSLNQLKEHLANCHTYAPVKRKNVEQSSKGTIKKMLFRCQYCDEAFISQSHREGHECSLKLRNLEHVNETDVSTTCGICSQDFGSGSELLSHQELDHKNSQAHERGRSPAKYVACPICEKRILVTLRDEHIKRHELSSLIEEIPAEPSKCDECSRPMVDNVCSTCAKGNKTTICPVCDIEVAASEFDKHVAAHTSGALRQASGSSVQFAVCSSCDNDYKIYDAADRQGTCRKCREPTS